MASLTLTALGIVGKLASGPLASKAERSEKINRALRKLGISTLKPGMTFEHAYVCAIVEWSIDKDQLFVQFVRDNHLTEAIRDHFATGNTDGVLAESVRLQEQFAQEMAHRRLDYDLSREIPKFYAIFLTVVERSRTVAEISQDVAIDDLAEATNRIVEGVDGVALETSIIRERLDALAERLQEHSSTTGSAGTLSIGLVSRNSEALISGVVRAFRDNGIAATCYDYTPMASGAAPARADAGVEAMDVLAWVVADDHPDAIQLLSAGQRSRETSLLLIEAGDVDWENPANDVLYQRLVSEIGVNRIALESSDTLHEAASIIATNTRAWLANRYRTLTAMLAEGGLSGTERDKVASEIARISAVSKDPLPLGGQADLLASRLSSWFRALQFREDGYTSRSDEYCELIVNVPDRRRYQRVLVVAVVGEADLGHMSAAKERMITQECDEAWIVADTRVSAAARSESQLASGDVECMTFDELIEQDADFSPYLKWLEEEVKVRGIDRYYEPLGCRKEEGIDSGRYSHYPPERGGLEGYVDRWVDDPTKEHLSILGEFGTGKTWFMLHYAWGMSQNYKQAKSEGRRRPRLPLVVPLRDYAKAVTVESLFSEFFFQKHNLNVPNYQVFEELNRLGRFMLLFDGFDEMASRVDRQAMVNNFWELARVVGTNAKALLTCRTEHFPSQSEGRALLGAKLPASTAVAAGEMAQFETIEVEPLTDAQIAAVLARRTTRDIADRVMGNASVRELAARPVMIEILLDALPELEEGGEFNLTQVYYYAIRRKMSRDIRDQRTFTDMSDKMYFLAELSWQMYATDQMSINYREFPDAVRECFGDRVKEDKDLDHWHHDMLGQTILVRNAAGDYSPAHRSFLEFFVAYRLAALLGLMSQSFYDLDERAVRSAAGSTETDDAAEPPTWREHFLSPGRSAPAAAGFQEEDVEFLGATLSPSVATPPVLQMLADMSDGGTAAVVTRLQALLARHSSLPPDASGMVVRALHTLDSKSLIGADLRGIDLTSQFLDMRGFNFESSSSPSIGLDLSRADLRGANLRNADLDHVRFVDADLRSAVLEGARFFPGETPFTFAQLLDDDSLVIHDSLGNVRYAELQTLDHLPDDFERIEMRSLFTEATASPSNYATNRGLPFLQVSDGKDPTISGLKWVEAGGSLKAASVRTDISAEDFPVWERDIDDAWLVVSTFEGDSRFIHVASGQVVSAQLRNPVVDITAVPGHPGRFAVISSVEEAPITVVEVENDADSWVVREVDRMELTAQNLTPRSFVAPCVLYAYMREEVADGLDERGGGELVPTRVTAVLVHLYDQFEPIALPDSHGISGVSVSVDGSKSAVPISPTTVEVIDNWSDDRSHFDANPHNPSNDSVRGAWPSDSGDVLVCLSSGKLGWWREGQDHPTYFGTISTAYRGLALDASVSIEEDKRIDLVNRGAKLT